ncbi:hypothetical protein QW060_05930 [Myroides ceti]|uniref:Uncharacterized protein n=1 Tax=Paenimyroides ceti TaxID=395087 RepID=A0ABT8CQA0_9FLAO|nr:hypothetical protein [Paenimyroides ceti]MDN3706668.1 hypothetical protein [Paenimyroides ceti]
MPNTAFQSQREQPFPTLQKALISSTSTAKLSNYGSDRNTKIRTGRNEK